MRRAALALLALGFAATLAPGPWGDESVSDLFVYRTYAEQFLGGALPYRDVVALEPAALLLVGARDAVLLLAMALTMRELVLTPVPAAAPARSQWRGRLRLPRPAPR